MLSLGQYGKNQSNMDIFRIDPIPVSPITTCENLTEADDRNQMMKIVCAIIF
jgi:hypothetical protein